MPPVNFTVGGGGDVRFFDNEADQLSEEIFTTGRRYYQKRNETIHHVRKRIRTRIDSFMENRIMPTIQTDGENRCRNFLQRFTDGFRFQNKPLRFEKFQLKFIDMVAPVLAPNIVGPQWTAIGPRLSREYGWPLKRMPRVILGQAPRRFGKTVSLGAIMLNYALEVGGCIQSAFSTSKRASQKLKAKVYQMCIESGLEDWVWRSGDEQLYLKDPNNENDIIRQMNFYPANKVYCAHYTVYYPYLCNTINVYNRYLEISKSPIGSPGSSYPLILQLKYDCNMSGYHYTMIYIRCDYGVTASYVYHHNARLISYG